MNRGEFYERYWQSGDAPPTRDPTTPSRMRRLQTAIRDMFPNRSMASLRVLDAGCGDGEFIRFLRYIGCDVSGIDVSPAAIAAAGRRDLGADLRVASLDDRLPFPDASFDVVWCTEVLEHLFDTHATLVEFNRLLRPNAALILTTPFHGFIKNMLIAALRFEEHFNPELSHIRFFTHRTLARALTRAGFVPVKWGGIGRLWPVWQTTFVVALKQNPPQPPPLIRG